MSSVLSSIAARAPGYSQKAIVDGKIKEHDVKILLNSGAFHIYIDSIDSSKTHWTQPVMGTAALFTSAATFSVAVDAAPLLFFVTRDKRQRRCFFSQKKRQRFSAVF